jgi:hypothetical protein
MLSVKTEQGYINVTFQRRPNSVIQNPAQHRPFPVYDTAVRGMSRDRLQMGKLKEGETRCIISMGKEGEKREDMPIASVGVSKCHKGDKLDVHQGRKIALARALRILPRERRTQIWEAFWDTLGKTK